jgi:hypothetical protein
MRDGLGRIFYGTVPLSVVFLPLLLFIFPLPFSLSHSSCHMLFCYRIFLFPQGSSFASLLCPLTYPLIYSLLPLSYSLLLWFWSLLPLISLVAKYATHVYYSNRMLVILVSKVIRKINQSVQNRFRTPVVCFVLLAQTRQDGGRINRVRIEFLPR